MAVKLHISDKIIFEKITKTFAYEGLSYPEHVYYLINDYEYEKDKLKWVNISVIVDIQEYLTGTKIDLYEMILNDKIGDEIRKDVEYLRSKS